MPIRPGAGYRHERRFGVVHVIAAVVITGALAALLVYNFVRHRDASVALAKAWAIEGPPCPSLSKADFEAKGYKAPKTFDYDGMTMARKAGNASCSDIQQNGGKGVFHDQECQFTSPAALIITTNKGAFFYVPEPGQTATVVVHDGAPQCVLGGKFTLNGDG